MANSSSTFPPLSFFFTVSIAGESTETNFQEVSGLEIEMEMEEIVEGGQNAYKHRLPVRSQFKNVVMKRGLVSEDSKLFEWVKGILLNQVALDEPIEFNSIDVQLNNPDGEPLRNWQLVDAYPVKWSLSNLSSTENSVLIETVEFAFKYIEDDY